MAKNSLEVDNSQKSELEQDLAEFNKPSRIRSLDEVTRNITYWENDQHTKNMIFAFNRLQPADVNPFSKNSKIFKKFSSSKKNPKNPISCCTAQATRGPSNTV